MELLVWIFIGLMLANIGTCLTRVPWEAVLKGEGRMDIVQERNLEGIGTDCRYVRKDKPTRKKTSLSEQRGWQLRKTTKMLSGYPGRKLEVQKTK